MTSGLFSKALFVAMVGGAGALAWYGAGMQPPAVPAPADAAEQVTLPVVAGAEPLPQAIESAGTRAGLPTRLVVATAGVDAPIEGVGVVVRDGAPAWDTAWMGVGHHIDSAMPGQPGNVVITGHVSVADHHFVPYFADLDHVKAGDIVEVYSGLAKYRYRVEQVAQVEPDDVRVLRSDHRSLVTLITCTKDLKHRLVVTGSLVTS